MNFPIPASKTFPWDVPLNRHIAQLNNPTTGGLNTWDISPSIGVDGQTLSTRHTGYTGFNTTSGSLERWNGSSWENLVENNINEPSEIYWRSVEIDTFGNLGYSYIVNPRTQTISITLPNININGSEFTFITGEATNTTRLVRVMNPNGSLKEEINDPLVKYTYIYSNGSWTKLYPYINIELGVEDLSDITIIDGGDADGI